MCLISVAGVGINKYSDEFKAAVKHGMSTQSDGTGFAYWRHGTKLVHYEKGFISKEVYGMGYKYRSKDPKLFDVVWSRLLDLKLTDKDILVIHHRSSTSGTEEKENCHPFELVSDDSATIEDIVGLTGKTSEGVLFHNGIFSAFNDYKTAYSDTARVTDYLFTACPENIAMLKRDSDRFQDFYSDLFKNQKVVVLTPGRCIYLGVAFVNTQSGYKHSNMEYSNSSRYRDVGGSAACELPAANPYAYGYDEEEYWRDWEDATIGDTTTSEKYDDSFDATKNPNFDLEAFEESLNKIEYPKIATTPQPASSPFVDNPKLLPTYKGKALTVIKAEVITENEPKTIEDIKREFSKNITENYKILRSLIILDPEHAKNFFYYRNGSDSGVGGFAGYNFFCDDFDPANDELVTLTSDGGGKFSVVLRQNIFLDGYFMAPKPGFYSQYMSYINLVSEYQKMLFSGKALKYLTTVAKAKPKDGLVLVTKPFKAKLHVEGVRLFNKVYGKDGLKDQLFKQMSDPNQLVLIPS